MASLLPVGFCAKRTPVHVPGVRLLLGTLSAVLTTASGLAVGCVFCLRLPDAVLVHLAGVNSVACSAHALLCSLVEADYLVQVR